jgi:hypothetical protein
METRRLSSIRRVERLSPSVSRSRASFVVLPRQAALTQGMSRFPQIAQGPYVHPGFRVRRLPTERAPTILARWRSETPSCEEGVAARQLPPVVDDKDAGPVEGGLVRLLHRDALEPGAVTAREQHSVGFLAGEVDAGVKPFQSSVGRHLLA